MKIYNAAVTGLAIKYTGKALNMHLFLKGVKARGDTFGWKSILAVPVTGGTKNLTNEYGQMYEFLLASLTAEAMMAMVLSTSDHDNGWYPGQKWPLQTVST